MSKVLVSEGHLQDIAATLRARLNTDETFRPGDMAAAVARIHGEPVLTPRRVTENGTYTPAAGVDGFSQVEVAVPAPTLISKSITSNGVYDPADDDADGYSGVTVNVSGGGTVDPVPPAGYQALQYIAFTASAGYLVAIPSNCIIEASATPTAAVSGSSDQCVIGYRVSSNASNDFELRFRASKLYGYVRDSAYGGALLSVPASQGAAATGKVALSGARTSAFIGRYANYSSSAFFGFTGYIHCIRITDPATGSLLMKYVPCRNTADNTFGFYDVVNGVYYSTADKTGGGSVSAGPDAT